MHPLISCPYCKELKYKHKGKNDPDSADHTDINFDDRVVETCLKQFDSADAHFPWVTKVRLVTLLLLLGLSEILLPWFQFLFVLQ